MSYIFTISLIETLVKSEMKHLRSEATAYLAGGGGLLVLVWFILP